MKRSIQQQIAALPEDQRALVPEIKVEIEPIFEVTTPAPDMSVLADVMREMMNKPEQAINVTVQEPEEKPKPKKRIQIDVAERDSRGLIKTLICSEL